MLYGGLKVRFVSVEETKVLILIFLENALRQSILYNRANQKLTWAENLHFCVYSSKTCSFFGCTKVVFYFYIFNMSTNIFFNVFLKTIGIYNAFIFMALKPFSLDTRV